MFIKKYLYYLTGYVKIKVESAYIERFINMCRIKKIQIWNTKRDGYSTLHANVNIEGFRKIKEIAKKTNSKIEIEDKNGVPFLMHKYRKRKIFLVFLGIIFIGIYILSRFIWNIDISGNTSISKAELLTSLKNEGLYIGISKQKLDTNDVINKIRLNRNDIAWIGITVKGTNAIVEVKEVIPTPNIIDENEYCNIVADKTGIITSISVQNGTAAVEVRRYCRKTVRY